MKEIRRIARFARLGALALITFQTLGAVERACFAQTLTSYPNTIWLESESFADKGGWGIDTQSVDSVGSPYLIAHGWGNPVADAKTKATFPSKGEYVVYARTRNWVATWTKTEAPGRFQILVDGKALKQEFGNVDAGESWSWQSGGTVEIGDKLDVEIALRDLTGFDGRVDAIVFTRVDSGFEPSDDLDAIKSLHREALRLPETPPIAGNGKVYDLVVVGGGLAGTSAAIAAARLGCAVAFIQDRKVLGGNGSTEIRVTLNGYTNLPPYPNLGNLTRLLGPHRGGNARYPEQYKDQARLELVEAEKNIDLYLGVRVDQTNVVEDQGVRHIESARGTNIETGEELRFVGKTFADCTGDGVVGFLAGADWRMGREAKSEYGEPSALDVADKMTMGSSVQWNTVETDEPSDFPELPWAIQFNDQTIRPSVHGDWDWEGGMNRDQIYDMERIRDNGLRAAYGHWSYMKNKATGDWAKKAKNRKLNWVAYVAGKRESRRLLGDVVLREQDLVEARPYDDACVVTTWSIDLHFPNPENAKNFPGDEFRASNTSVHIRPYAIPYRCFYSRNVDNLFMAGRDASFTHVALGSVRVMRTCGQMGEVVGMAASICKNRKCSPRDVYAKYLDDLKAILTKGVAPAPPKTIVLQPNERPNAKNVALDAKIEVSGYHKDDAETYKKEYINDGKYDISSNDGRWVSSLDNMPWADLIFDEPTTINTAIVVTGQGGGATPMQDFYLMYEDESGKLADIKGAIVANNKAPIVELKFDDVTSKRFRVVSTITPDERARLWEVELYRVDRDAEKNNETNE